MGKSMLNGECYGSDNANDIVYDNTKSGLTATNTKSAIDELATSVTELNYKIVSDATWKRIDLNYTFTKKGTNENEAEELITIPELINCTEMWIKTDINECHLFNDGGESVVCGVLNPTPASDDYKQTVRFYVYFTTGLVKGHQYSKGTNAKFNTVKSIYYK